MSGHLIPKHQMSEEDIKANFITPALESSGWKNGKDILYEYSFTGSVAKFKNQIQGL